MPTSTTQFKDHQWLLPSSDKYRIPFVNFVIEHIDKENIVFQSNHFPDIHQAVYSGMGIGPLAELQASSHDELVKMEVKLPKASESIWFVYHKDLKHSIRIKSFYDFLTTSLIEQD